MKKRLYHILVNQVPGIRSRYLSFRKKKPGIWGQLTAWLLLFWWHFLYWIAGQKSLGLPLSYGYYEEKPLLLRESAHTPPPSIESLAEKLKVFDVISFDIFDTLLVRPFSKPEDLFYLLGMKLKYPDFPLLRMQAEQEARERCQRACGSTEVRLEEIWEVLAPITGLKKEEGIRLEKETEEEYCQGNPYFIRLLHELRQTGKPLFLTSDMYLDKEFLEKLLEQTGLGSFCEALISCEYRVSKTNGGLYRILREKGEKLQGKNCSIAHVGDNRHSDIYMAQKARIAAFWYPNPQETGNPFRPMDMSAITGTMYRGTVNLKLHTQGVLYSPFYEYGYIYGGLCAMGYCRFLHKRAKERGIENLWFLSRDGEILKKIYDFLYPKENTAYILWSRNVSLRLSAKAYPHEFFQRFLFQKADQGYSIENIFSSMKLLPLLEQACHSLCCSPKDKLTTKKASALQDFFLSQWNQVNSMYQEELVLAASYLESKRKEGKRLGIVDIGWTGSGALGLSYVLREACRLPYTPCSFLGGTATCHNPSPDVSQGFFFQGEMESYFFSQEHNRDLWKFHDLHRKHNLYIELLFTSPSPSFRGFGKNKKGEIIFLFGEEERHKKEIREIQKGIWDFVQDYEKYFGALLEKSEAAVSGRDAYAPILLFLKDRKLQRRLEKSFFWDARENVE